MSRLKKSFLGLAAILYFAASRVVLLLSNGFIKSLLAILPKTKDRGITRYEIGGEMFTLQELSELMLINRDVIEARLSRGETIHQIVDNPSPA